MKFLKRKSTIVASAILLLICLSPIVLAFHILPNPFALNPRARLLPPSCRHPFGTDQFGRDVLARVLEGSKTSLLIGAAVASISLLAGIPIGLCAGYFRLLTTILMRLVDALMAFPSILLALSLMAILGKPSVVNVIIAIAIVYTPRIARLVYGATLVIRELSFVEAAQAIGASTVRILYKHVLTNLISPVLVYATFIFAFAILEAAALDFLGVGIPPEVPSWGGMINENRVYIFLAPWGILFPGLFLGATVFALNVIGDNLRDFLDPRIKRLL
ncbi:MAG: ABC transporter permease [Candidatus Bipolaricaulaceae bacterium]